MKFKATMPLRQAQFVKLTLKALSTLYDTSLLSVRRGTYGTRFMSGSFFLIYVENNFPLPE
jgi:hypothetical protein